MSRTRSRIETGSGGAWSRFLSPPQYNDTTVVTRIEKCVDTILPGDGHPFNVNRESWSGGVINSSHSNPNFASYKNWVADMVRMRDTFLTESLPLPDSPPNSWVATNVTMRTNPSKPVVDVPVGIAELGDAVRLLQSLGRSAAKKIAGTNINYQFGVAPLVGDVVKLLYIEDFINKRVKTLESIAKGRGSKTVRIGSYSNSASYRNRTVNTSGSSVQQHITKITTQRVWGHIKWTPTGTFASLGRDADVLRKMARRAVLGLEFNFHAAWELIPFSWLIDYFTDVGNYLSTTRNAIECVPSPVQVMRHTITTSSGKGYTSGSISISDLLCTSESKSRFPVSPTINANIEFLNKTQMSTIASLYVLQRR